MKFALLPLLLLLAVTSFAQQDTTKKPETATHAAIPSVPVYAIVLDSMERNEMLRIISEADEKPSTVRGWINYILSKSSVLSPGVTNVSTPQPSTANKSKNGKQ